jgi:hypothetical protein
LAGLGRVKAKTLSGSGRVSRLGRVMAGVTGLSSGKAKTSPRPGISLIPQPVLCWLRPLPVNPNRVNFLFLKYFINSNHFDPNSNLNYERLLHVKQNTRDHFITQ